ncbi:hypothetical protein [Pseudanabaena mucicola]|uniref:hypothetical protein n=1 Tax=Pseudanabaena mucicola TaxID=71190 RepID=UPI0025751678|nr:hypothetical protein [Pseudanabaena mucicola]
MTMIAPSPPTDLIAYLLKSNSDRTLPTHKPDRLSSQIKQRSPFLSIKIST